MAFTYFGIDKSGGETEGKRQQLINALTFGGACNGYFYYSGTQNFGNAATGLGTFASLDVTVTGVRKGDIVMGVSVEVDTIDAVIGGAVTADDTVTLTLLNNTSGAVDLASTTCQFIVADMT